MEKIKEAFSRIYTNIDILPRHLALLALAGIATVFVYPLNQISASADIVLWQKLLLYLGLGIIFAINIYLFAYGIEVFKSSRQDEVEEILPPLKWNIFKNVVKIIPSVLMWCVYLVLACVLCSILTWGVMVLFKVPNTLVLDKSVIVINPILVNVVGIFTLVCTFIVTKILFPFVMAQYSENQDAKGLWRFTVPFRALFSHFKEILLLWVKLLPLFILLLLLLVLSINYDVFSFVIDIFRAYISLIVVYVMYYNYVQILKK